MIRAVGAAFAASPAEVVEAFTVVLAVATLSDRRPALRGTATALALLAVPVLLLGGALSALPFHSWRFSIGVLLLLFGLGWLRKAILRAGGAIPLRTPDRARAPEERASPVALKMFDPRL